MHDSLYKIRDKEFRVHDGEIEYFLSCTMNHAS
jgi:hypothetical protein